MLWYVIWNEGLAWQADLVCWVWKEGVLWGSFRGHEMQTWTTTAPRPPWALHCSPQEDFWKAQMFLDRTSSSSLLTCFLFSVSLWVWNWASVVSAWGCLSVWKEGKTAFEDVWSFCFCSSLLRKVDGDFTLWDQMLAVLSVIGRLEWQLLAQEAYKNMTDLHIQNSARCQLTHIHDKMCFCLWERDFLVSLLRHYNLQAKWLAPLIKMSKKYCRK